MSEIYTQIDNEQDLLSSTSTVTTGMLSGGAGSMTTFHMKAFLISFLIIPIFIVGQIIGISVAAIGEFPIRFFFGMFVYVETESENVIDLGNVFMSYFQNLLIFIMILNLKDKLNKANKYKSLKLNKNRKMKRLNY